MKSKITLLTMLMGLITSAVFSQSLISENKTELSRAQQKNEMDFALRNYQTNGVTVFFEPEKAEKVKGEKRKYQRYEMALDENLKVVGEGYKIIGTKNSVKPRLYFDDFRIGYTTWVDDETDDKVNKIMFQLIKYDNNNVITSIKDFEMCDEKGFDSYRVVTYEGKVYVMAQYEKRKTKNKDEKNRDYLVFMRINPISMDVEVQKELNLLGKDELGLESFLVTKDKIFLAGKSLLQTKVLGWKIPKGFIAFRLSLDGDEEARGEITIPAGMGIANIYMAENNGMLYMAGEYGDPKAMGKAPKMPANNKTVKVSNPYLGMFIKKFDFNLQEQATATFDYKEKVLRKLKKGNAGFTKRGGNYNLQDFYFLPDGSFYITAEMFTKFYETRVTKTQYLTIYNYYTHYNYMDALLFKFTPNGELDWVDQIDRDNYRKTYSGHIRSQKPLDPGKLITFLGPDDKLAMLYNTPGRKYGKKRFGLSEVIVSRDGQMTDPYDFTSNAEFGLLDDGIISIDPNTVIAVGTDKKGDFLWTKKISLFR